MEFRILGPLEVVAAGESLALGSAQQRAVLGLLLVRAPEPVSRDRLIDELWGERPPASAAHAVQVYVSGIRKVLRGCESDGVAVRTSASGYRLVVDSERIDARRFERLLDDAQRVLSDHPLRARELLDEALALWRGPPLVECATSEFARREADRLEELRLLATEDGVEARLAFGEHGQVVGELGRLVVAEPLRERPRRLLMLALYRGGRHAEALAVYRDACAALDEIGLRPGPELRELEAAILRHDPSLESPSPAARVPRPPALRRSALPAPAHALVGRKLEMAAILTLLARSEVRLVTLLGPGGSGKTRLALEVAAALVERYRDGVWFVSLAPLADPDLVAAEIGRTVGLEETDARPLLATLADSLASRELLLVLDNFEHLVAAAQVVSQLLSAVPGLDVLVTSRAALQLTAEHRFEVPGLPLAQATELFLARARAVRRDLAQGDPERQAVETICRRLDGLPLALELAAASVALFSLPALASRLAQRLDLPEGARDLPDRQRTLRAAIDWSYQLLSPGEQKLFRGLAPFAGGARLEAIESVFDDLGVAAIDAVAGLVDKSLLRRRDEPDGVPRFWLLETIREYALERLTSNGEAHAAATQHAGYFLELAEQAERRFHTDAESTLLARLETEHDNLRAAFDFYAVHEPSRALRMASALGHFWDVHGHLSEGRERLDRALAADAGHGPVAAKATLWAARMATLQGDVRAAEPLYRAALRLARDAHNAHVEALALSSLGMFANARGDAARGVELTEQGVCVAREAHDDWILASTLSNLGTIKAWQQDDGGRALFREALELFRRIGDSRGTALVAANLTELALSRGELETAQSLIDETRSSAHRIDYRMMTGIALCFEALLAMQRGERDAAEARMSDALKVIHGTYDAYSASRMLAAAATLATARGAPLLAAQLWAALDRQTRTQPVSAGWLVPRPARAMATSSTRRG